MKGSTIVITGGAGAIGRAIGARFAREGTRIALLDRDAAALDAACAMLHKGGADVLGIPCDVTDAAACEAAMALVLERFGGIDVLVNNAGLTHVSPALNTQVEVYRRVMDVNYFGAVHCTLAALPSLVERRGCIAVTSSIAGLAPLAARTGYCASKHALHGFFDTLRAELRPLGVAVVLVCPSFVETPFARSGLDGTGAPLRHERTTMGRPLRAEQVAEAVYVGVSRRTAHIILPRFGAFSIFLWRFFPSLYERLMLRNFQPDLQH